MLSPTNPAPLPAVGFQGAPGAYSEEAVRRAFGAAARPVPFREFRDVGAAVEAGAVDLGLLPIENTIAGSVLASYDVLASEALQVVGEVVSPIHHCLLGTSDSSVQRLRRVLSHPVALAQCRTFLDAHPHIQPVAAYDTAGAAAEVADAADPATAAIASRLAGERYGLRLLAEHVEDRPDNQTRFLIVGRRDPQARAPDAGGERPFRTTLLVETPNEPGALVRILRPFAERGLNLSRLDSRPGSEPWTSRFFIEVDAAAGAEPAARAIAEARDAASSLRVLGSYPRWDPGPERGRS